MVFVRPEKRMLYSLPDIFSWSRGSFSPNLSDDQSCGYEFSLAETHDRPFGSLFGHMWVLDFRSADLASGESL